MRRQHYGAEYPESCSYRRYHGYRPYPATSHQPVRSSCLYADTCPQGPTQLSSFTQRNPNDPFSPQCRIPLPNPYGQDFNQEPVFIRKRNERERERVRCVNDGYARLRQHVPNMNTDKRVSKVETLRAAIRYIQQLKQILKNMDSEKYEDKYKDAIKMENKLNNNDDINC